MEDGGVDMGIQQLLIIFSAVLNDGYRLRTVLIGADAACLELHQQDSLVETSNKPNLQTCANISGSASFE